MPKPPSTPGKEGSLRRAQVVTSFGPGSTLDLPERSVIIGGLEYWRGWDRAPIIEPRLSEKAAQVLGVPRLDLYAPPVGDGTPGAAPVGIGVTEFPSWFVADLELKTNGARSRPLANKYQIDGEKLEYQGKKWDVTPVRFVQGCPYGHLADIEWREFTHGGRTTCQRQLWLDERGSSGDLTDLEVRCDCGMKRALAQAKRPDVLGQCKGQRPWLPQGEKCGGPNGTAQMMRLLIRTGSNAYFPQKLSVLSLPDKSDEIRAIVKRLWSVLKDVDSPTKLAQFRLLLTDVRNGFAGMDDDLAYAFIAAEREGRTPQRRAIKLEEFAALSQSADSLGEDRPEGLFYARRLALPNPKPSVLEPIERVVLVHRLREVTAQLGFTRFEALVPDVQGEYEDSAIDLKVRRASLAMEPTWLPAVEVWGEGVFISLRADKLKEWRARREVRDRQTAFDIAATQGKWTGVEPDVTYVMMHTLSHLLITALALECGYNTGSLRERVYLTDLGAGILVYTASNDADGTLGGLVEAGRQIDRYLSMALELGRLCSNDPVCAQHAPDALLEERYTLGAACHGCLLIAETSCERRNELLDRSLVVPTVEELGCEFFAEPE